jgi:hypothetical protein
MPSSHPRCRRRYTPISSPSPPKTFTSNRSIIFDILANADAGVGMLGVDVIEADATPTRRHHRCTSAAAAAAGEPRHCNTQQPLNAASQLQRSAEISL